MTEEKLELPQFTLKERELRYEKVKSLMRARGLDCLLVRGTSGHWDSHSENMRYLTQIGGNGEEGYVVFPLQGEPTCYVWVAGVKDWWLKAQAWVTDLRVGGHNADVVADRIKELGLEKGHIGLVGLAGSRTPEGIISHEAYLKIEKGLPQAHLSGATDLLEECRLIKSNEEINFHEKAAHLGELAVQAMLQTARPGVRELEVYAQMIFAMLKNGAEYPVMLLWEAGPAPFHASRFPTARPLKRGDIIINEITPKYGGYWAHPHQPVALGPPKEEYQKMFDICLEAFNLGLEKLKPGITLGELDRACLEPAKKSGYSWSHPAFHGMGLGQIEPPIAGYKGIELQVQESFEIKTGMVLALQPSVATPDWKKGMHIGDTVVVTEKGARVLSGRKIEFITV